MGKPRVYEDDVVKAYLRGRDILCPECEYNRRDGTSSACPECGHSLSVGHETRGPLDRRAVRILFALPLFLWGTAAVSEGILLVIVMGTGSTAGWGYLPWWTWVVVALLQIAGITLLAAAVFFVFRNLGSGGKLRTWIVIVAIASTVLALEHVYRTAEGIFWYIQSLL